MTRTITLLPGDGIGPEVSRAARRVVEASGAPLDWDVHTVGEAAFAAEGNPLPGAAVAAVQASQVALKGPVTTPMTGYRSVNASLRAALGLYVQVRPACSLPGVALPFTGVDCVVIRATNEDLYSGVEFAAGSAEAELVREAINHNGFAVTAGSGISVKTCSVEMVRRVSRFAFGWALANGRRRVTIAHKATNIRHTDGLFLRTAREVAEEFDDLSVDDCLVDRTCEILVRDPGSFDVILTQSVYGDLLSDLCSGLVGGVGVAPGANYGDQVAIFEPVHGSAPRHAGQDRVNPTGAILSAAMLLEHVGEWAAATRVRNALNAVVGAGTVTYDLAPLVGVAPVSTTHFTDAVVAALDFAVRGVPQGV